MASSTSFAQIWSGVQVEQDGGKHSTNLQSTYDTQNHIVVPRRPSISKTQPKGYKLQIVWRNVYAFIVLHMIAFHGLYLTLTGCTQIKTTLFMSFVGSLSAFGITVGAHRLWTHRCYKARLPLRILLALFQTLAVQNHIYEWVRDHRVHHKFTDTDADPHNSTRGFFFSHMGWLLVRKHPDVALKGKTVDMTDVEADPVVIWQRKYYFWLVPIISFIIPSLIPYYLWNERYWYSFTVVSITRYMLSLHFTWLVNSAAHIWGTKPYDKNITPTENYMVAFLAYGEGWHNYHHAFPWDYKAAELGNYRLNFSTAFIDICARLGLAYNMKMANVELIEKRAQRTGDGTRKHREIWGWDDDDMTEEDRQIATVID